MSHGSRQREGANSGTSGCAVEPVDGAQAVDGDDGSSPSQCSVMPRNGAGNRPRERSASSFSRHRQISRDQTVRIIELFRPSLAQRNSHGCNYGSCAMEYKRIRTVYLALVIAFYISIPVALEADAISILLHGYGLDVAFELFDRSNNEMVRHSYQAYSESSWLMHYLAVTGFVIWIVTFFASFEFRVGNA